MIQKLSEIPQFSDLQLFLFHLRTKDGGIGFVAWGKMASIANTSSILTYIKNCKVGEIENHVSNESKIFLSSYSKQLLMSRSTPYEGNLEFISIDDLNHDNINKSQKKLSNIWNSSLNNDISSSIPVKFNCIWSEISHYGSHAWISSPLSKPYLHLTNEEFLSFIRYCFLQFPSLNLPKCPSCNSSFGSPSHTCSCSHFSALRTFRHNFIVNLIASQLQSSGYEVLKEKCLTSCLSRIIADLIIRKVGSEVIAIDVSVVSLKSNETVESGTDRTIGIKNEKYKGALDEGKITKLEPFTLTMLGGIPNPTMKFLNYYIFNDENRRKCWKFIQRMEVWLLRGTSRIERRWKKLHANYQVNNE